MKKLLMCAAFTVALTFSVVVAQENACQRHSEPTGGFSICQPEGWNALQKEGQKFKMLFGQRGQSFTPNINFRVADEAATLADYVAAGRKLILGNPQSLGATSIEFVDQADFKTDSGLAGFRVSFRTVFRGLTIRTLQYYFNGKPGQKLVVTGTALEAEQATNDKIFDRAVKGFRLEP